MPVDRTIPCFLAGIGRKAGSADTRTAVPYPGGAIKEASLAPKPFADAISR